jgi:hypothetical protein
MAVRQGKGVRKETDMSDEVYTLGAWRVKNGRQREFVEAWLALGQYFASLPHPPGKGTLLQSVDDAQQFYSFGPWRDSIPSGRGATLTTSRRCEASLRPGTRSAS